MTLDQLAARLTAADDAERAVLVQQNAEFVGYDLARSLKALFDEAKYNDPVRAHRAVRALAFLSAITSHPETTAVAVWTAGIELLQLTGQAELATAKLDEAAAIFTELKRP